LTKVPFFGLGISPFGPKILATLASFGIMEGSAKRNIKINFAGCDFCQDIIIGNRHFYLLPGRGEGNVSGDRRFQQY